MLSIAAVDGFCGELVGFLSKVPPDSVIPARKMHRRVDGGDRRCE